MDPYEIFGLKYPSTKEVIKTRYYELARKHHPDKLQHLSKEEIEMNEKKFKEINRAYEILKDGTYVPEWNFKSIFETVINRLLKDHHITVDVTLEEMYNKKEKRLRLFLKGVIEPLFITIQCGDKTHTESEKYIIHLTYNILPHDVYTLHENNIYSTLYISLYEYIKGCVYKLEYLDGSIIDIHIKPCDTSTIYIPDKGIDKKGSLILFIVVDLPTEKCLQENQIIRNKLLKYLKLISNASQNGVKAFKE
jgi:DnaJ-class molecular chaperone